MRRGVRLGFVHQTGRSPAGHAVYLGNRCEIANPSMPRAVLIEAGFEACAHRAGRADAPTRAGVGSFPRPGQMIFTDPARILEGCISTSLALVLLAERQLPFHGLADERCHAAIANQPTQSDASFVG
jgi:hypothetical protein